MQPAKRIAAPGLAHPAGIVRFMGLRPGFGWRSAVAKRREGKDAQRSRRARLLPGKPGGPGLARRSAAHPPPASDL